MIPSLQDKISLLFSCPVQTCLFFGNVKTKKKEEKRNRDGETRREIERQEER